MKISITFYVTHFLVFVLFISGLFADLPFIQNNKYPNGPQKDWNQRQFNKLDTDYWKRFETNIIDGLNDVPIKLLIQMIKFFDDRMQ